MTAQPKTDPKQAAQGCAFLLVLAALGAGLVYSCRPKPKPPTATEAVLAQMCSSTPSAVNDLATTTSERLEADLKTDFNRSEGIRAVLVLMLDEARTNPKTPQDCNALAQHAYKTVAAAPSPYSLAMNTSRRYSY